MERYRSLRDVRTGAPGCGQRDPAILVVSGALFIAVLIRGQMADRVDAGEYRFSVAVHEPRSVPAALNGFALWVSLMIGLTVVNYGFPIAHLLALPNTAVPIVRIGAER